MRRVILPAMVCGLVAVFASGCGTERVPVYPVSGRLMINGKPPSTEGWIVVLHLEPPPASTSVKDYPHPLPRAKVEVDGSFHFHTYETRDGAPAGTYKVSFINMAQSENSNNKQAPGATEDEDEKPNKNAHGNNKNKEEKSRQVYWPTPIEIRPESNELPPFDIKIK